MKHIALAFGLCVGLVLFTTGCAGTLYNRVGVERPGYWFAVRDRHDFFGAYPYQAIVTDVHFMDFDSNGFVPVIDASVGFVSIPLDFGLDTVFILPDAICWSYGMQKKPFTNFKMF